MTILDRFHNTCFEKCVLEESMYVHTEPQLVFSAIEALGKGGGGKRGSLLQAPTARGL